MPDQIPEVPEEKSREVPEEKSQEVSAEKSTENADEKNQKGEFFKKCDPKFILTFL